MTEQEKAQDTRMSDAIAIKDLLGLKHSGFVILRREWEKIKAEKLADLTNEKITDDSLKARQVLYNEVCEWIDLPALIVKRGEAAVEEEKDAKEIKDHPIKRAIPFIGGRY